MADEDLVTDVKDVLAVDREEFQRAVEDDAERIKAALDDGVFDNPQGIIGFEYEFYAVAHGGDGRTDGALMRVPRRLLELIGFEKELGLHNAEMSTSPQPLNAHGLAAQEDEVKARLRTALETTQAEGMRLVSDGLWTIPPEGETTREYLADSVDDRGVRVAANMSDSARYHAMANTEHADAAGMYLDAPHVDLEADTVMPEALITSIQPHYQVAHAADLPTHFRYAIRVAAPLLALGVNSPFFPPDLYDDGATAEAVLRDGYDEHRISVFETVLNADTEGPGKVRFPQEIETVEEAVDRIANDTTFVPMPVEEQGRYDDEFAHFRQKHGTFWRWVRPVFGGPTRSAANARIEFRPMAAQPTVRDSIAYQAAFAGLMESLPRLEHPVAELDWETARDNFYDAARNGLDASIEWITNDGTETTTHDDIYSDLLDHAAEGLRLRGLSDEQVEQYIWPLRFRARHRITPADWKRDRAWEALDDGKDFVDAVHEAQRAYFEQQRDTLLGGSFPDWIDGA